MSNLSPLPSLLLSTDLSVRSRGVSLLSSFLISHSSLVLDNFSDFLPFFMGQLAHGQRDSMGFSSLNYFVYRAIVSSHSTVNQKSLLPLLQYLSAFLDAPPSSSPIGAVSYITFPARKYLKCVKLLASRKFADTQFLPLLRVLAVTRLYDTEDRLIGELCGLLAPSASQFADSVAKWPDLTVSAVIRSLLILEESPPKERLKVPELASQILHSVIVRQKSNDVARLCFPYLSKIRTHPLYATSKPLQEVHSVVTAAIKKEKFTPEIDASPFAIFAGIEYEAATFASVTSNFMVPNPRATDPRAKVARPQMGRSLMSFLDSEIKLELQSPQLTGRRTIKKGKVGTPGVPKVAIVPKPIAKQTQPVIAKMRVTATKKKTGKFGSASKYSYEFSAMNRSLVWRAENRREIVKGAIIFQAGVEVHLSANVVAIKSGGKTHEIQFENTRVAELWFAGMKKVVTTPAK